MLCVTPSSCLNNKFRVSSSRFISKFRVVTLVASVLLFQCFDMSMYKVIGDADDSLT